MMKILQTLTPTLPVIFLVLTGLLLRRVKLIQPATAGDLKKLVINLTLPLVLFNAFGAMTFEPRYLLIVGLVFGACSLVLLAAELLAGKFPGRIPGLQSPSAPFLMAGFEAGMLGYAVYSAMFGAANVARFAVVDLGQVIFVFFILVTRLENRQGRRFELRQTLLNFLRTPVILAILAGMLANFSGLYAWLAGSLLTASLLNTTIILGGLTTPLVALVIGYELQFQRGGLNRPLQTVALRLVVWVSLAMALNLLVVRGFMRLDAGYEAAVMLMAVLPAPFVVPFYAPPGEKADQVYILNTLSLGTLAALLAGVIIRLVYA